jgi:hypothetical protein
MSDLIDLDLFFDCAVALCTMQNALLVISNLIDLIWIMHIEISYAARKTAIKYCQSHLPQEHYCSNNLSQLGFEFEARARASDCTYCYNYSYNLML